MASKTERPKITIHDVENDSIIVREMNDEEYTQHLIDVERDQTAKFAREAKENARLSALSKLQQLGLTEDEAKAFLG